MKKSLSYTFLVLVILTILSATISHLHLSKIGVAIIVISALIKFLLVGFQFLELKAAHRFWQILFVIYSVLIGTVFIVLL